VPQLFGRAQSPEIVGKYGCSQRFSQKDDFGTLALECKIARFGLVPYIEHAPQGRNRGGS
jgi:hypothetical protein